MIVLDASVIVELLTNGAMAAIRCMPAAYRG